MQHILSDATPGWVADGVVIVAAIAAAIAIHWLAFQLLRRLAGRSPQSADDVFVAAAWRPARWIAVGVALAAVRRAIRLDEEVAILWSQIAGLAVPAMLGWLAIALIRATEQAIVLRADISVADNLRARRRRTRASILARIAIIIAGFATIALMLLSIPSVRAIGVTLMASAGIAGLAVGAAAQPALKNLIAGVQMAFTEPIRLDDVLIVDGEWGRVEEIRLTYVVVALWDERRLVVPVSRFLEQPFQNWTRRTSQLLGSAFLYLDPVTDVPRLRSFGEKLVRTLPQWDGRAFALQVTDMKTDAIEVRVLATARDAPSAFDLRCGLREGLLTWIKAEMPEALPRRRLHLDDPAGDRDDAHRGADRRVWA